MGYTPNRSHTHEQGFQLYFSNWLLISSFACGEPSLLHQKDTSILDGWLGLACFPGQHMPTARRQRGVTNSKHADIASTAQRHHAHIPSGLASNRPSSMPPSPRIRLCPTPHSLRTRPPEGGPGFQLRTCLQAHALGYKHYIGKRTRTARYSSMILQIGNQPSRRALSMSSK